MPRKPVIRSNSHYYHVTARSNNKEDFNLPIGRIWDIMTKNLLQLQLEFDIKISGFVLMNNHFHLLLLTPKEDIDRIMYFFMKKVTLKIQKHSGRINKIFGGRYKGSIIMDESYLLNVYKYICRNPVVSGLIMHAEEYPYSTLFYYYQPRIRKPFLMERFEFSGDLHWINQSFNKREAESIKSGLSKTKFTYQKENSSGKFIEPLVPQKKRPN